MFEIGHARRVRLTSGQFDALDAAQESHDALDVAHELLVRALGRAQPGREVRWAEEVSRDLDRARRAIRSHRRQVTLAGGLYEEIRVDAPRLLPRLAWLERDLARIEERAEALARKVVAVCEGDLTDLDDIRSEGAALMARLRSVMAAENDLVYERFEEPPALD